MNKVISKLILVLTVIFLVFNVLNRPLQAYERKDLIDSAAIIICISNVTDFLKAIEQSNMGKLWNRNEMKPFLNNQRLMEALEEAFLHSIYSDKPNNKELSFLLKEGLQLMTDEVVIGISPPDQEGKTIFFVLAAMNETGYQERKKIDERMAELDDSLSAPYKEVFQGVDLIRTNRTSEDKIIESEWEAFYGGTVINSTSREWIERCIVRLKQELPTVPTGSPMLHLRITDQFIKYILEAADQSEPEEEAENTGGEMEQTFSQPPPSVILNALGLDLLKYISLDLFLKPKALEFQFSIKKRAAEAKGFWTLLSREHVPLDHRLPYVPADVYSYQVMQLDFNALWKELPEILKSIDPQYIQYLNGLSGMFKEMYKIDLSRDVFGNLGTLITAFSRMEGLTRQDLYSWQLRNSTDVEKLLAKLYGEGTPTAAQLRDHLEIHQLHGHKLYSFKSNALNPALPPAQHPGQENIPIQKPTYTGISVVGGALVFGNDRLVRSMIQAVAKNKPGTTNSLYQIPEYTSWMRTIPDSAVGYSIIDLAQMVRTLLEFAKKTMITQNLEMKNQPNREKTQPSPLTDFFNKLQFDRLPSFDFITSFFDKGVSYTQFEGNDLVTQGVFRYRER